MFMYLLYIYKKPIILSLFKIDTLNFTMYVLENLTYPLKTYVRSHNLISMNIFFAIRVFLYNCKERAENKDLLKTQTSLNLISMNIFFTIRD